MKIKKEDNVIVIAGKDKGKTGKVVRAFPRKNLIVISGINLRKVHKRPTKSGQKGQIIDQAVPMHVSNVLLVDPKNNKGTRVGYKNVDGNKVRIAKKSGSTIGK